MAKPTREDGKRNGTTRSLPEGPTRLMALVERSQPSGNRPILPKEFEDQLRPVHAKAAACYASMEDLSDRIAQLANRIGDDEAVVIARMDEDENSVVHHIDEVNSEIHNGYDRLVAAAPTPHQGTPVVDDKEATDASLEEVLPHGRASTH